MSSIEDLPYEILVEILKTVPGAEYMYEISKQFNDIVREVEYQVSLNPDKYIDKLSPPVSFLLKDKKYHKAIWDKAILEGNLYLITRLDKLGYKFSPNIMLQRSAERGHKVLVDFFIEKGASNWQFGLSGSAKGGHEDLIDFFIKKGANDWNLAMQYAAEGGHKNSLAVIEFFINKGANDWNDGMVAAAKGGHKYSLEIIEFFIEKGANHWNRAMRGAAQGGHKDLVEFFIEKGANNLNDGMAHAALGGHKELVKFLNERT